MNLIYIVSPCRLCTKYIKEKEARTFFISLIAKLKALLIKGKLQSDQFHCMKVLHPWQLSVIGLKTCNYCSNNTKNNNVHYPRIWTWYYTIKSIPAQHPFMTLLSFLMASLYSIHLTSLSSHLTCKYNTQCTHHRNSDKTLDP